MGTPITRRSMLLGGVALFSGCSAGARSATSSARVRTTTPSTSPTPTLSGSHAATPASLPDVHAWQPSGHDEVPECKLAAVRHIERMGNGADTALQVIEAQYGGLLPPIASVLVVTRSWERSGDQVIEGGHTYDVRLTLGSGWAVTQVHPSAPGPPDSPTALARRVLASSRIDLPPAGRADVRSGQVHGSVLEAMLAVSARHRIGVSVIRSGHPLLVFGTDRPSDHPQGRAFDTWRLDGQPVVEAPRTLVTAYMEAVAAAGSYNVGGPYLLGSAPQWFSDDTHHDHVHAGFAA